MFKKFLILSLVLVVALGIMPLALAEETVLTIGGWPAGDTAFEAIIPKFLEDHPGVRIELNFMSTTDFNQALTTAIAAGSGADDIVMLEQAWLGRYKDGPGFENLLDPPYNAGELKKDFVEYKWDFGTSLDGKRTIGLIWDIGPASLFYRRDIFEEVGLPSDPAEVDALFSTWDGFLEAAEKVYIPGERWLVSNAAMLYSWCYMNRDFFDKDLNLIMDKEVAKEALEAAIKMRQNGWDAKIIDMWSNEANAAFGSGQVATVVAGCWYGGFLKTWIAPDTGGKWGVARLPGGIGSSNWGGSHLAIPSQSKNKELAWEFIKYALATKEAQNKMFEVVDYFPGYIPAWDDPIYHAEDPFFGGQKTRELWVDIAESTYPSFSTLMDTTAENAMGNAVRSGLDEGLSADEIIENVKKSILNETLDDYERMEELMEDAGLR